MNRLKPSRNPNFFVVLPKEQDGRNEINTRLDVRQIFQCFSVKCRCGFPPLKRLEENRAELLTKAKKIRGRRARKDGVNHEWRNVSLTLRHIWGKRGNHERRPGRPAIPQDFMPGSGGSDSCQCALRSGFRCGFASPHESPARPAPPGVLVDRSLYRREWWLGLQPQLLGSRSAYTGAPGAARPRRLPRCDRR
jgi:hypothetical protein